MTDTPSTTNPRNLPNLISALRAEAWWLQPNMTHALMGQSRYHAFELTAVLAANLAETWKCSVPRAAQQLLNAAEDPTTKAHLREYIALIGAEDTITVNLQEIGIELPSAEGLGL